MNTYIAIAIVIGVNLVVLLVLAILIWFGVQASYNLTECETEQSPYCYTINCPGDASSYPCYGYAYRTFVDNGQTMYACSNNPTFAQPYNPGQ